MYEALLVAGACILTAITLCVCMIIIFAADRFIYWFLDL